MMNAPGVRPHAALMHSPAAAPVTGRTLQSLDDAAVAEASAAPAPVRSVPNPAAAQLQSHSSHSAASASASITVPPLSLETQALVPVGGTKRARSIRIADDEEEAAASASAEEDAPVRIPAVKLQRDGSLVPLSDLSSEYQLIRASRASRHRPPSQYIYCSQAQQLSVEGGGARNDGLPSVVALLIPSEYLNATAAPRNSLVEVTCSVMDMNAYPLYQPANGTADDAAALQRT